ncbi:MAG: hypothetical protein AAGA54_23950 [Myxococcota bacterium]
MKPGWAASLSLLVLVLPSCKQAAMPGVLAPDTISASQTYDPIDPVSFWDFFVDEEAVPPCRALDDDSSCSVAETLANFPNDATQVSVFKVSAGGSVDAPFVGLASRGEAYRVIVDYVKYRTDVVENCVYRSGIGVRMRADLRTSKSKLDISSPISIGTGAELGHISGSLRFETIGLSGKMVTTLVPIPSQISAESIQKAMEAAASIKANIYNATAKGLDVFVEPQVFAEKCAEVPPGIDPPSRGAVDPLQPKDPLQTDTPEDPTPSETPPNPPDSTPTTSPEGPPS